MREKNGVSPVFISIKLPVPKVLLASPEREAGLAEQRSLLVARRARNLDFAAEVHRVGVLIKLAVGHWRGQHTARYIEDFRISSSQSSVWMLNIIVRLALE